VVYRAPAHQAVPIPRATPIPAHRPLDLGEQRTILDFAERCPSLTPERAREIAELAVPISGAAPGRETERLLEIANFLSGRRH
jgi:hypothetical protein